MSSVLVHTAKKVADASTCATVETMNNGQRMTVTSYTPLVRTKMRTTNQFLVGMMVWMALALSPALGLAQEQDALRLIYVNIGDQPARSSYHTVDELLAESPQIELVGGGRLLRTAGEYGLDETMFHPDQRGDLEDEFAALMWEIDVEGILIHDVSDDRQTVKITVVGPRGWLMREVEQSLDYGDLDRRGALEVLEEIFSVLVPEVRGFRRDLEEGTLSESDFEMPEVESDDDPVDAKADADQEEEQDPESDDLIDQPDRVPMVLERNVSARAGLSIGRRSMTMDQDEGTFSLRHTTALVGPAIAVDAMVATFEEGTMGVEVGGLFSLSPFYTVFDGRELDGQYLRFGAEGRYVNTQLEEVALLGILGIESMNLTLEENENYTGHGYMTARIGGGARYHHEQMVSAELDVLLLPILSASNSGGAYGVADGWFGVGVEAKAVLELFDPLLVSLDYGFKYLDTSYPEPELLEEAAASQDTYHQVMVTVGYKYWW